MSIPDSGLEGFGYDPPVTDENTPPTDPTNPNQQPADIPAPPPEQPSTPPPPPPPPTPYSTQPPGPMPGATPDSPTVVGMPPPPPPGYAPTPPPGYVPAPPPPPPGYVGGPPPPTYPGQPAYGSAPPPSRGGPSVLLLGGLSLILVVLGGLGGMFVLKMGPFAPAPTLIAQPSLLPTATPSVPPTGSLPPTPTTAATSTPGPTPTAAPSATEAPTDQPTAEPTATAGETPSAEPSAEPTSSAEPTPQPTSAVPPTIAPGPDEAADVLLSHIPEEFRANCTPSVGTDPVLALAACSHDDGELLMVYWLYGSREEMNAAYQIYMLGAQIEPDTGDCSDPDSWPTENGYSVSQVNVGRYLCLSSALPTIYWTDDRFNILSQASHALSDYDRLLDFWISEAGPI